MRRALANNPEAIALDAALHGMGQPPALDQHLVSLYTAEALEVLWVLEIKRIVLALTPAIENSSVIDNVFMMNPEDGPPSRAKQMAAIHVANVRLHLMGMEPFPTRPTKGVPSEAALSELFRPANAPFRKKTPPAGPLDCLLFFYGLTVGLPLIPERDVFPHRKVTAVLDVPKSKFAWKSEYQDRMMVTLTELRGELMVSPLNGHECRLD
jgi:hypothetical protein